MPICTASRPIGKSVHPTDGLRAGVLLALLMWGAACTAPRVDGVARYREDFARAQETGTIEGYRGFLLKRPPTNGHFAEEQAVARKELKRLELQEALAQDLGRQIRYVCEIQEPDSRDQVFASVCKKLQGKSRVECMQWLWPLGRCAEGLQPASQSYLRTILGLQPEERTRWERQDWIHTSPFDKSLGPYGAAALSDLDLTRTLVRIKMDSGRWAHDDFVLGALLHASCLSTELKWAPIGQPFADGGETTPRQEALRMVAKVLYPSRLAEWARDTQGLAGNRAWSVLLELMDTPWFRSDAKEAFHWLLEIDRPGVQAKLLPIALETHRGDRVPCLLRCLKLDVPGLQEHLAGWIESEYWPEQALAALVIARYRVRTEQTLEALRRWEVSPQRGLRFAARRGLQALGEAASSLPEKDTDGMASAARHLAALDRGFVAPEQAVHLAGLSKLPKAPLDHGPLRFSQTMNWMRESHLTHAFQTNCWALEYATNPQAFLLNPEFTPEEEGLRIPAFAVLICDPMLAADPEDERAFLLYPEVSFCCQDSDSGEILVGNGDYDGVRFRPACADLAQAAKAIFARQGLRAPFENHRAGVVLVLSDSLLDRGDEEIARQVKSAWSLFLQCAKARFGGELYAAYNSAWWKLPPMDPGFVRGKALMRPSEPRVQKASAEILRAHAFVPGATKNPYTLSLSPAAGTITTLRDEDGCLLLDLQTESGDPLTIPELLVTCVEEGDQITQGQVLGLRARVIAQQGD